MIGWIIALVIIAGIAVVVGVNWSKLSKEHNEARNLPLNTFEFKNLKDGTYTGTYGGGMYKWRTTEVEVTVVSGRVTDIQVISTLENKTYPDRLYKRILEQQTFPVDVVSGATLSSRAVLKAVENALEKAR